MPDLQIPVWLAGLLTIGLPTIGWFVRKFFERRWAKTDRVELRAEANLEEQQKLLRELNGERYLKWCWLATHPDASVITGNTEQRARAEDTANDLGTWLYKHSSYFPEEMRVTMVNLGHLTFRLATHEHRAESVSTPMQNVAKHLWKYIQGYQRKVERKLGLEEKKD